MHARYDGAMPREARDYIDGRRLGPLRNWPTIDEVRENRWGMWDAASLISQLQSSVDALAILLDRAHPNYGEVREYRDALFVIAYPAPMAAGC